MCVWGKVAWREVSSNPFHPINTSTTTPVYVWLREGSMTWDIVQSIPSHNYSHNYSCVCVAAGGQPDVIHPIHSIPQLTFCMCGCGRVARRELSPSLFYSTTTVVYVWLQETSLTWGFTQSIPLHNCCCVCVAPGGEPGVRYRALLFTSKLFLCMFGWKRGGWRGLSSNQFYLLCVWVALEW